MPGLFSWYNNGYASWNRMRRIQAPQTVARVDSRTSRVATAIHNGAEVVTVNPAGGNNANAGDVVINMGDLSLNPPPLSPSAKDNKDTLFGPSIGVVNTAPEWCAADAALDEKLFKSEKRLELNEKLLDDDESSEDELTPEIVKEWVRRSKEPSEPTTTLQALVNLKRPSIRLSPLAGPSSDPSASSSPSPDESSDIQGKHHQQHGLEFEFDCDAPQCLISLHAFGVPASMGEPDEQRQAAHLHVSGHDSAGGNEKERLVLFEATLPGGFARKLTLGDGAVLELARLEAAATAHRAHLAAVKASTATHAAASASSANVSVSGGGGSGTSTPGGAGGGERHEHHMKRLTTFFRKRGNAHNSSHAQTHTIAQVPAITAGPALAVVDAEATHLHPNSAAGTISLQNQNTLATFFAGGDAEKARRKREAEEEGVRIAIRIAAKDEEGRPMKVRNEQVTYLHIVRQGSPPGATTVVNRDSESSASADGTSSSNTNAEQERREDERDLDEDDSRPWVVRVVKREARIGAHSFQLHEIYGLTAHASASDNATGAHHVTPSSPSADQQQHTYPPTPGQPQVAADADDSPAECLLCLSAAREVVLLPCRHLVACRECAVNMVEFGAGGTVVQPSASANAETETPAIGGNNAAAADGENNAAAGEGGAAAQPTTPTPTPATRRKRKAKGWFCPVCRQPYTSLLRITTAPPPSKGLGLGQRPGSGGDAGQGGDAKRVSLTSSVDANEANDSSLTQQQLSHPLATVMEGRPSPTTPRSGANGNANASSEDITSATNANANLDGGMENRGGLVSLRPSFFSRISGRGERDLERGA